MLPFLLTLCAGAVVGYAFYRLKIPGGVLVGGIVGAAVLNIVFNAAAVPPQAKILAQLTAGAFIGSGVTREDLRRLRHIWRPALLLMSTYLGVNLFLGFVIYITSPLDLITSLFCVVPGGISDVPLISADMGADAAKVAVLQFVRMLVCTGTFPVMISRICKNEPTPVYESAEAAEAPETPPDSQNRNKSFLFTYTAAFVFGIIGYFTHMPAGTLVFSMFGVVALNLATGRVYLPMWTKRLAQVLSGIYIGSMMGAEQLLELRFLLLPMAIQLAGYTVFCFGMGALLKRRFKLPRKEAMLMAVPSGASDMALISLDMGVQSTDLVLLQVIRLITTIAIFPQAIYVVCLLAGV